MHSYTPFLFDTPRFHLSTAVSLALATAFSTSPMHAFAQAEAADSQAGVIEEVVVTALRRAEGTALSDTPLSIDAISGSDLEAQGFTSVMDAISTSPGVSVAESIGVGASIQIRGVSGIVGDAVVGYYLDDLPYTRLGTTVAPDLNPYDLNRVEVLRGPQSTLFGAGSQGGTVRILTKDAVLGEFSGKVTTAYSTTDDGGDNWKVQGAVNVPLGDAAALRIVGSTVDQSGFIDLPLAGEDDYNTTKRDSYRAKLKWTPNDEWSFVASYWFWEQEGFQNWGGENLEASPFLLELDSFVARPSGSEFLRANNENELFGFTAKYTAENFSFVSATSLMDASYISAIPVVGIATEDEFGKIETFSQEFTLNSDLDGRWNWNLGAIFLDMENGRRQSTFLFASVQQDPFQEITNTTEAGSESWAVFGESYHDLTENLVLTLGLRYFDDEREVTEGDPLLEPLFPLFGLDATRSGSWDKVTGRVNLSWTPTEDALYYFNYSEGFRSGGLNPASDIIQGAAIGLAVPLTFDPDQVNSYEIGAKWVLMDGSLTLETAAYYLDWEDIQSFVTTLGPDGDLIGWADNASQATGVGVDFALSYQHEGLFLGVSANLNETEYDGDVPSAGIADGTPVTWVPEVTWAASAGYSWSVGGLMASAFMSANYTDERSDYSPPNFVYTSDDITVVSARVGVEADRWSLFLTGENLLNEDGEVSQLAALAQVAAPPVRMRPTTIGLELNFQF